MRVIDASVLTTALTDDTERGDRYRSHLKREHLLAPELIDIEVVSAIRGMFHRGDLERPRARLAIHDLGLFPVFRVAHRSLVPRCWELRDNVTPYDAGYVALAEARRCPLLTADRKLANAPGPLCEFEVLE